MLKLKIQRDKVNEYQKKLNGLVEREKEMAKQLLREGKKDRALLILKKKKMQMKMIERSNKHVENIEEMIGQIEITEMETEIFQNLRQGTDALKELQKEMSIEDVEQLMDDSAEAMAMQKEISDALGQSLAPEDVAEADEDLLALEEQMADELGLELNVPTALPSLESSPVRVPDAGGVEVEVETEGERQLAYA